MSKFRGLPECVAKMRRGKPLYYHIFLIIGIQILGTQLHILLSRTLVPPEDSGLPGPGNKGKNHHSELGIRNQILSVWGDMSVKEVCSIL